MDGGLGRPLVDPQAPQHGWLSVTCHSMCLHAPHHRKQIGDAVHASLASEASLSTDQAADALGALCALEGLDSQGALGLLLSSRRAWMTSLLAHQVPAQGGAPAQEAVAQVLAQLAQSIQSTICQVGYRLCCWAACVLGAAQGEDAGCGFRCMEGRQDM